ncbi:hypothetical protein KCU92_g10240, partial [Aureobasidium melanogenum]|jgi:predicted aspartyl protease
MASDIQSPTAHTPLITDPDFEASLVTKHYAIPGMLSHRKQNTNVSCLIDCGATGFAFIDQAFAHSMNYPLQPLSRPQFLTCFDGRETISGTVTHIAHASLSIGPHKENIAMFVTQLHAFPVILGLPWLERHNPSIDWASGALTIRSEFCMEHCLAHATTEGAKKEPFTVYQVGAAPFLRLSKRKDTRLFAASMDDIEKALRVKPVTDPRTKLPAEYHQFLEVFSQELSDSLPPHRSYDHKIPLLENASPPFGPLYGMSRDELQVLKKYLDENLAKGFIRPSSSSAASPVLFVKKPGGGLRFCADYRGLNALTHKNRYPLPLISETLDRLSKAKWFTKIDIIAAFNKLRMAAGEEWKTAIRTRYGLYEYLVMPFGLANAPASFQNFINDVLREFLDKFATAYMDDILVYSNSLSEHKEHVAKVLQALKDAGLQADIDKCEFHKQEVKYLGLIISTEGVKMDPQKVSAILDWPPLTSVKEVQSFLGFANFYRRFIKGYSSLATPLTKLTRKDQPFDWDSSCEKAFDQLKSAFLSAPILQHFDFDKKTRLETDASDGAIGGILSQQDDQGFWKPVAYMSAKMLPAECNYEIYDKELLAIVRAFEEWRPELEGSQDKIEVLSDHKNLVYFMKSKLLNRRQARWSEFLSRFNFEIAYIPGAKNNKADALTRRSGDLPCDRGDGPAVQEQVVLKTENLSPELVPRLQLMPASLHDDEQSTASQDEEPDDDAESVASEESESAEISDNESEPGDPLDEDDPEDITNAMALLDKGYERNKFVLGLVKALRDGDRRYKFMSLAECTERDGRVYVNDKMFVPKFRYLRLKLIEAHHCPPPAAHPGRGKTLELLKRSYYWPRMHRDVARFVKNCITCKRSKPTHDKYKGLLQPLTVPYARWKDISMDFITELPRSATAEGQTVTNIFMVVDRLTKMRHIIPIMDMQGFNAARMFYTHVWKLHGLPDTIVSDRGPQFISGFWKELMEILRIETALSTADHPETDGQSENANAVVEQMLRGVCNYLQGDWAFWIPSCEFAVNNWVNSSTNVSPFFANYGQHPRMGFEPRPTTDFARIDNQAHLLSAQSAEGFAQAMERLQEFIRGEMLFAQEVFREYADRNRTPAPDYAVGDLVFLDARNLRTLRPVKKLDWKNLGPFPVAELIGKRACRLTLPDEFGFHDVFHVSYLIPAADDPLPGQNLPAPPPRIVDGEQEWEIEDLLDKRAFNDGYHITVKYRVKWRGSTEETWVDAEEIERNEDLVADFHRRNPNVDPNRRYRQRPARRGRL